MGKESSIRLEMYSCLLSYGCPALPLIRCPSLTSTDPSHRLHPKIASFTHELASLLNQLKFSVVCGLVKALSNRQVPQVPRL